MANKIFTLRPKQILVLVIGLVKKVVRWCDIYIYILILRELIMYAFDPIVRNEQAIITMNKLT